MIRRVMRERLRRVLVVTLVTLGVNSILPIFTAQAALVETPVKAAVGPILAVGNPQAILKPALPAPEPIPVAKRRFIVRASAYSSTKDQTDNDPFTTASGTKVRDGTVAMNCLPFGTKIRIPAKFGQKIFTVEDRMAKRWGCSKMDLWMTSRELALQWGVRTVTIEIL